MGPVPTPLVQPSLFLQQYRINLLPPWPAQSPDLNPVEHCWSWLARRLVGRRFRNTTELWAVIQAEWEARPLTLIPALYASLDRRAQAVIDAKGGHTRY